MPTAIIDPGPKFSNDLKILRKFRVGIVVSSVVVQANPQE